MNKAIYIPYDIGLRVQHHLFNSTVLIEDKSDEAYKLYCKILHKHGFEVDNKSGIVMLKNCHSTIKQKSVYYTAIQMWSLYDSTVRFSSKKLEPNDALPKDYDVMHYEVLWAVDDIKRNDTYKLQCGFDYVKANWSNKTD